MDAISHDNALDVVRPALQGGAFLGFELMTLINSGDAGERAADVVHTRCRSCFKALTARARAARAGT